MEGEPTDNTRPPAAEARSNPRAQTVHPQAPTMTSVRNETDNSSESTSSGTKSDHEADHAAHETEDQRGDPPGQPGKGGADEFLSKPLPPSPRTSHTPAMERQTPTRERTHPLRTEGLDHIVIDDGKKGADPKGRGKLKDPETGRRPRRQDQQAPRKRDPSAHNKSNKDRDPSARRKRKRPPSPPKERGGGKGTLAPTKTTSVQEKSAVLLATVLIGRTEHEPRKSTLDQEKDTDPQTAPRRGANHVKHR